MVPTSCRAAERLGKKAGPGLEKTALRGAKAGPKRYGARAGGGRVFFGDMVASGPLWLVPSLLGFVASEAAVAELRFGLRTAGTIPIDDLPY